MPRAQQIAAISQNRLLAVIPPEQLGRLAPQFRRVPLVFKETLFEAGEWIEAHRRAWEVRLDRFERFAERAT